MENKEKRDLSFFFPEKIEKREENFTLKVSERFKDDKGKVIEFEFIYPDHEQFKDIKKEASKKKTKNGKITFDFSQYDMYMKAITECNTYPNFKNANLQDAYKATSARELVEKMLYPDEIENLGQKLSIKIGLMENPLDLVDDAKN